MLIETLRKIYIYLTAHPDQRIILSKKINSRTLDISARFNTKLHTFIRKRCLVKIKSTFNCEFYLEISNKSSFIFDKHIETTSISDTFAYNFRFRIETHDYLIGFAVYYLECRHPHAAIQWNYRYKSQIDCCC